MRTIRHMKFPIRMELDDPFDNLETPIDFFGKWAETGKDKGMEKGHAESVKFMVLK